MLRLYVGGELPRLFKEVYTTSKVKEECEGIKFPDWIIIKKPSSKKQAIQKK